MRFLQPGNRVLNILRIAGNATLAEGLRPRSGCHNVERVFVFRILQQRADDLNLSPSQHWIPIARRFEQKHPIAVLLLHITFQFRPMPQHEVLMIFMNRTSKSGLSN